MGSQASILTLPSAVGGKRPAVEYSARAQHPQMRQHTSVSTVLEDGSVSIASPPAKADQKLRGSSPTFKDRKYQQVGLKGSGAAVNEVTASRESLPTGAR